VHANAGGAVGKRGDSPPRLRVAREGSRRRKVGRGANVAPREKKALIADHHGWEGCGTKGDSSLARNLREWGEKLLPKPMPSRRQLAIACSKSLGGKKELLIDRRARFIMAPQYIGGKRKKEHGSG